MRKPSTAHKLVAGAVSLTVVAAAWFWLAPAVLGGSTSYVATEGVSMEPRFHTGDLVLVRARNDYRVGDIVAYHSVLLNTIVLHRIVGRKGRLYVFKGDNNGYVDPQLVAPDKLVGTLWVHLPGAAASLASLRSPTMIGALMALGVLFLGGGAFTRQRRRRRNDADGEHRPRRPQPTADWVMSLMTVGAFVLAPLTALALLAFSKPLLAPGRVTVPYKQRGSFAYFANTVPGAVYPSGRATTGDPLFLKLVKTLEVRFAYRFKAGAAHNISGVASLDARLASTTGWKRTLTLQKPTRFSGDRITVGGAFNLAALPPLLQALETSTNVRSGYTLELVPHVHVDGTVGGFPLDAKFGSPLAFSLNDLELQPTLPGTGVATAGSGNPLTPSASGSTAGQRLLPAFLQFKVARLYVARARTIASRGLVTAICALLGCALALRLGSERRAGAVAAIEARYRRWLVPVAHVLQAAPNQLVEMADMEALARIAERYDRMILHESSETGDTFSVAEDGVLYQFAVAAPARQRQEPRPQRKPAQPVAPLTALPPLQELPQHEKRSA